MFLISTAASASVTLPLQGYTRPGRYFPIQVDGNDTATPLSLVADGCLPTQMIPAAQPRRIIPMLAAHFPRSLEIKVDVTLIADKKLASTFYEPTFDAIPLRVPGEDERLVASTSADISPAIPLFPGQHLLPIRLEASDPLPGPPAAWEALDAILLDAGTFLRITDTQRSALLAGGMMLICTGDSPPDARWPWVHRDQVWVLSNHPAGPVAEVVSEDAYSPTYAWSPGWPARVRGQVMGIAVLLVIIIIALLLRPNRWTLAAALALPILVTLGIAAWRASLGTITRAGGDIIFTHGQLLQHDAWVYERPRESSTATVNWSNWTHPVFASEFAMQHSQMKLIVTAQGDLQFSYAGIIGHTMGFIRREILPGKAPVASLPLDSPMLELARSIYLQQGDTVSGQIAAQPGRWPTVLIHHQP